MATGIYRFDAVHSSVNGQVLIVSTPQAADALANILQKIIVVSWIGNHNDIDWSDLQHRRVVLWADNDDSALSAMAGVCGYIRVDANPSMKIMRKPQDKPAGWGPLDAINDGWSEDDILEYAKANVVDLSFPKRLVDEASREYREKRGKAERPSAAVIAEDYNEDITLDDIEAELAAREG